MGESVSTLLGFNTSAISLNMRVYVPCVRYVLYHLVRHQPALGSQSIGVTAALLSTVVLLVVYGRLRLLCWEIRRSYAKKFL